MVVATAKRDDLGGPERKRDRTVGPSLGSLPRAGPRSAVPPDLSSVQLARVVGLGDRCAGRYGAHLIDHPYWALGLKHPSSIEATSTPFGMDSKNQPASYPLAMQAVYHFPGAARSHR